MYVQIHICMHYLLIKIEATNLKESWEGYREELGVGKENREM